MKRFVLLSLLLGSVSCASQPICKPWSPEAAGAGAAPAPATAEAAAPTVDDGTVALAAAREDESWTSVVGEGPAPAEGGAARRRPRPVSSAPAASSAETAPAVAAAPPAKPAVKPAAAAAPAAPAKPAVNPKLAEGRSFFAGRCVPCHGTSGRGDGPAGGSLTPRPRNFTDRAWQKSVTDTHIEKVIFQGGPSVGKSPLMPAHADLKDPVLLSAVREVVRGFGR